MAARTELIRLGNNVFAPEWTAMLRLLDAEQKTQAIRPIGTERWRTYAARGCSTASLGMRLTSTWQLWQVWVMRSLRSAELAIMR